MGEMKRSDPEAGKEAAKTRTLDTQLNDINHFKSSNKKSKLQLFQQRDRLERDYLRLTQEQAMLTQEKAQLSARQNMLRAVIAGDLDTNDEASVDESLKVAIAKREELAATEPQALSGRGNFDGFREVLAISDRALQDASSALKEVSAAGNRNDGQVLEKVLETNLKYRRDCLGEIQAKLVRATGERTWANQGVVSAADRSRSDKNEEGMMKAFFKELSMS